MKLPKILFVSAAGEDDEKYLAVSRTEIDAINEDGPTEVGTYQLVSVNSLVKKVRIEGQKEAK